MQIIQAKNSYFLLFLFSEEEKSHDEGVIRMATEESHEFEKFASATRK